jgi:4-hydroxy-4-methyl-2-oxoglutarate aldolase
MAGGAEDRREVLQAYGRLRVADVRDGMDWLMMHRTGSMDRSIRPLWRTRAAGIARTARYVAYEGTVPTMRPEQYSEWVGRYYAEVCPYPWVNDIQDGDFMVIDASGVDAGLMGSENSLGGIRRGLRGYVTSGGVRDTDEVILEKIPFWAAIISQTMVQGRIQFDAKDVPVCVGGVTVHPGDVVVADGDGVIVVPRKAALEVARIATDVLKRDIAARRSHYEALGMPPDSTVSDA